MLKPRRWLLLTLLLLLPSEVAYGQLGLSYTSFQAGSAISSSQFTSNFTNISDKALNRYAPVLKATLGVDTNAAYDLGASGTAFRDGFFTRNVTVGGTATLATASITTLTCTGCVGATQIATDGVDAAEIAAGAVGTSEIATDGVDSAEIAASAVGASELAATTVSANSYGSASAVATFTVDADGRLTTAATTPIEIAETAITDGSVLARLGATETVTGAWTFTASPTLSSTAPFFHFYQSDGALNEKYWSFVSDSTVFELRAYNDAFSGYNRAFSFARTGASPTALTVDVATTISGATTLSSTLGVTGATTLSSTLSAGATTVTALTVNGSASITGTLTAGTFSPTTMRVGNGTTAAPTLSFTNDTDTGFYVDPNVEVAATVNGTTVMRFAPTVSFITSNLNARSILPNASATYDIGTSTNLFSAMYALAFNTTSDARLKYDIQPLDRGLDFILALKPKQFRLREDPKKGLRYGLIAQEVDALGFEAVEKSNPQRLGLNYTEFIAPLIKAAQEQHEEHHQLARVVEMQQAQITLLVRELKALQKQVGVPGSRRAE